MNDKDILPEGVLQTFDPELRRAFNVNNQEVDATLRKAENIRLDPLKFRVSGDGAFYTLQGEGVSMGQPAVFFRLHICNLRCVWCDAFYTWNPKSTEFWTESKLLTPEEAAVLIQTKWKSANPRKQRRLVITGGEPLIQQQLIPKLCETLLARDPWIFEIETNGTIMPNDYILTHFQFNCSPKLANSLNAPAARLKPAVLQAINAVEHSFFKFVVMSPEDLDEIERDFIKGMKLNPDKVILMPQGVTEEEIRMNMKNVAERAKEKGYRLLSRLHVDVWGGAKRRV